MLLSLLPEPTHAVTAVVTVIFLVFVFRLVRAYFKRYSNATYESCHAVAAEFDKGEDAAAHYRFTAGRLKRHLDAAGTDVFDCICIGSGPSSMGCAATLSRLGKRCCVLEQGEQLGGGAHVFSEVGFEFESGIHYLGGTTLWWNRGSMIGLLRFMTCGRLELCPMGTRVADQAQPDKDPRAQRVVDAPVLPGALMYDDVVIEGDSYPFVEGLDSLKGMLARRFPSADDRARVDRFFAEFDKYQALKGQSQLFFKLKVVSFLPSWLCALLQSLLCASFLRSYVNQSCEDLLRQCSIDPASRLAAVLLGQYGDFAYRPDQAAAFLLFGTISFYMNGASYPRRGTGQIPRKLNATVLAAGGISFVQARVREVVIEKGRAVGVRMDDEEGTVLRAKTVVSGIGGPRTYRTLLPPALSRRPLTRLASARATTPSTAYIFLFCGLDVSSQPEAERDTCGHNTWIYPSQHYSAMEDELNSRAQLCAASGGSVWDRPNPVFVASGSEKAGEDAPNRKTVLVLSQCPFSWVEPFAHLTTVEARRRDPGYQAFKAQAKEALMRDGFRRVFPHLERYIVHSSVGTPLTTNHFLATDEGEVVGLAALSDAARWQARDLSPYTCVANLFLTGQDVVTLGLPGALSAGYLTACAMEGYGDFPNVLLGREIMDDLPADPTTRHLPVPVMNGP